MKVGRRVARQSMSRAAAAAARDSVRDACGDDDDGGRFRVTRADADAAAAAVAVCPRNKDDRKRCRRFADGRGGGRPTCRTNLPQKGRHDERKPSSERAGEGTRSSPNLNALKILARALNAKLC